MADGVHPKILLSCTRCHVIPKLYDFLPEKTDVLKNLNAGFQKLKRIGNETVKLQNWQINKWKMKNNAFC